MRFMIETFQNSDEGFREESKFYGFFSFAESAVHTAQTLTKVGGAEAGRMFDVHEILHPGPASLSEWLMKVREQIEHQFGAYYNVDDDTFYETSFCEDGDEEDRANAAYKGAKLAMQLLEVQ